MFRSVLYLQPLAGGHDAIRRFFEEEGVLERSARTPGFLSAELHAPIGGEGPALVTALWESEASYRRWVEDPWRQENASKGAAVFEPVEAPGGGGARYEVTHSVRAPGAPGAP